MKLHNKVIKTALISVFDKTDIIKLAKGLLKNNIKIFVSTGTEKILKKNNINTNKISEITAWPEIMEGQIKTIHPKIFAGILGNTTDHNNIIQKHEITILDLIIVNFYPFHINHENINMEKNIDIGGPSMVRAAAKNYKNTVVITDIMDYKKILHEINQTGYVNIDTKLELAYKAFQYTTNYDKSITKYFNQQINCINKKNKNILFPKTLEMTYTKQQNLKYGENPHQKSALYVLKTPKKSIIESISSSCQKNGTLLSYNNIYDANTALNCVNQFNQPTCVIVKHGTPCGAATKNNTLSAYLSAYQSDPISAFGGIIGFNSTLDDKTITTILNTQFVELIIAPAISPTALDILKKNKKIKLLICENNNTHIPKIEFKTIGNSLLVQECNSRNNFQKKWIIASKKQPSISDMENAIFCWKIAKFVKSNAIVYGKSLQTISIGGGQTSRLDAVKIANSKYVKTIKKSTLFQKKIVMASDAFFPFRDGIDEAASIGVSCIIQPGGSIKDNEIIQAVNDHNICMIMTGIRNFRH